MEPGVQRWLEFHDSDIESTRRLADGIEMKLRGYVHQWEQTSKGLKGTGWMMPVALRLCGVSPSSMPESLFGRDVASSDDQAPTRRHDNSGWISDGTVTIDGQRFANVISLPFESAGEI